MSDRCYQLTRLMSRRNGLWGLLKLLVVIVTIFLLLGPLATTASAEGEDPVNQPGIVEPTSGDIQTVDTPDPEPTSTVNESQPESESAIETEPVGLTSTEGETSCVEPLSQEDASCGETPIVTESTVDTAPPAVTESDSLLVENPGLEPVTIGETVPGQIVINPALEIMSEPEVAPILEPEAESEPEAAPILIPIPDPYFFINAIEYNFLPSGGDCSGKTNCWVSDTPIQAAIDYVKTNQMPDGGIIYLETGEYSENIIIDSFNAPLTLQQSNLDSVTLLGDITISNNAATITLTGLHLMGLVTVNNSVEVVINGTEEDDEVDVAVTDAEAVKLTVNGSAGVDSLAVTGDAIGNDLDITTINVEQVLVDMGGGDDRLMVTGSGVLTGAPTFTVNGGDGNDTLELNDVITGIQSVESLGVLGIFHVDLQFASQLAVEYIQDREMNVWDGTQLVTVTANILTIGASNITAFFGIGDGSAGSVGLLLSGAEFALALLQDVADSSRRWLSLIATSTGVAFVGIPALTLTAGTVQVAINRKSGKDGTVVDYESGNLSVMTGDATPLVLAMKGADGELLTASGLLQIAVQDFVDLSGMLGFTKTESDLVAVGENLAAVLTSGTSSVSLTGADFGLKASGSAVTFELTNGVFDATLPGIDVTGGDVLVRYANATGGNPAGETLSAGGLTYTFNEVIAANTVLFRVMDFSATISDFVTLAGDLGISKVGSVIWAVGANLEAVLSAGGASVSLTEAMFGLSVDGAKIAFELSNGIFSTTISFLNGLQVKDILVQYTSATASVPENTTLTVGGLSYTFTEAIASGTMTFAGEIVQANLFDIFTIKGGFALQKKTDLDLVLSDASKVTANLLTIGLSGVEIFLGYSGIGLALTGVDLAIALWNEVSGDKRSWVSVMGSAADISFVGTTLLTLNGQKISLLINQKSNKDDTVVDYVKEGEEKSATDLSVLVAPGKTVKFEIDDNLGNVIRVTIETATLGVDGLFYVTGSFAFEKRTGDEVKVMTGLTEDLVKDDAKLKALLEKLIKDGDYSCIENLPVDTLLLGASNVNIFVGGKEGEELFKITEINFALGLFFSQKEGIPMMYALKASKANIDINLTDVLKISMEAVNFRLNGGAAWVINGVKTSYSPWIDFSGSPIDVETGAGPVKLDFDVAVIGVELVKPVLNIADFLVISADSLLIEHRVALVDIVVGASIPGLQEKIKIGTVTPDQRIDNLQVNINVFSLINVTILIGGVTEDEALFSLSGISVGLALISSTKAADPSRVVPLMVALSAEWDNPLDINYDGLVIKLGGLAVRVNTGGKWKDTGLTSPPSAFVDFVSSFGAAGMGLGGSLVANFRYNLLRVESTNALVSLFGFFYLKFDNFTIEKGTGLRVSGSTGIDLAWAVANGIKSELDSLPDGVLSDDYTTFTGLSVNSLMLGGEGVQLFVGYGPYFVDSNGDGEIDGTDTPSANAIGFVLSGLDFALAILNDPLKVFPTMFAFKGTATGVAVVGLPFLTLSASVIEVALNTGNKWKDGKDEHPFVDWQKSFGENGYSITSKVKLDFEHNYLKLAITSGKISILDFFHLQGSFAFEKGAVYTAVIKNDSGVGDATFSAELEVMTLGGQNLSAFVGYGQINTLGVPTSGSVGISIQNLTFGLSLFKLVNLSLLPSQYRDKAIFVALNAHVDGAGFVGLESIATLRVWDVTLELNTLVVMIGQNPVPVPIYIDFSASADGPFKIPTGADGTDPIEINYSQWRIRASVGFFEMQLAGVIYLAGGLNLDMGEQETVTLSDGTTQNVMIMTIAAVGVYGFLGFNGPYWRDTNGDHRINSLDTPNPAAVGFSLENLNLAIVIMKALPIVTNPAIYFAMQASLSALQLVGVSNVTASATGLVINLNLGLGFSGLAVVDFMRSFPGTGYLVSPPGAPKVYMTFTGRLIEAQGQLTIAVVNTLFLFGDVNLKITETELNLTVNAAFNLKVGTTNLLSGSANGTLRFDKTGLVGYVGLQIGVGAPSSAGFGLNGRLQLEINTTSTAQTIKRFVVDQFGRILDLNGDGKIDQNDYVSQTIAASSMLIFVGGTLSIPGFVEFTGSFELKLSSSRLEITLNAYLRLGALGTISVQGGAIFSGASSGTPAYFAMYLDLAVNLSLSGNMGDIGGVSISGRAIIQINTSTTAQTVAGHLITSNTYEISIKGQLHFWVFMVDLDARITIRNGIFEIAFATKLYFPIFSMDISGYIRSDGKFKISGSVGFRIDFAVFTLEARADLMVSNDPYQLYLRVYGSFSLFGIGGSASASVSITGDGIRLEITGCVDLGWWLGGVHCSGGSVFWRMNLFFWSSPSGGAGGGAGIKLVATVKNGTLFLSLVDAAGNLVSNVATSGFSIQRLSTQPDGSITVRVTVNGLTQDISGVNNIINMNTGTGIPLSGAAFGQLPWMPILALLGIALIALFIWQDRKK